MEVINPNNVPSVEEQNKWNAAHKRGKITGGLIVVIAGTLLLGREIGLKIPDWLFTWQMLLITLGVFIGIKKLFSGLSWLLLIAIGSIFLVRDFVPDLPYTNLVWPVVIILIGLAIVFKPRKKACEEWKDRSGNRCGDRYSTIPQTSASDVVEINSIFGGVERIIVSKNFKGGEINSIFGGAEVNLSKAEITDRAELEVNAIFGGVRIVIPPNWSLQSELTAVMGSVEDKRPVDSQNAVDAEKVLVLKGHAVFGGIEVQSF
jgi:predicted membrane protein